MRIFVVATAVSALWLVSAHAEGPSKFHRVARSYTQKLHAVPETILPLLTPVKETLWADGWQAEMIYPASGEPVSGSIFTTHTGERKALWIMTRYDPDASIVEYFLIHPNHHVRQITIRLKEGPDQTTDAHITYIYTATDELGDEALTGFTEESWKQQMTHWEKALNHYLQTGKKWIEHEGEHHANGNNSR